MIYVINYTVNKGGYQGRDSYFGEWYFYYGNGEYGIYPTKEQSESNGVLKTASEDGKKIDMGDSNLDGTISIKDATEIQKYIVGLTDLTYVQEFVSDINGDIEINISDATDIQKLLVS